MTVKEYRLLIMEERRVVEVVNDMLRGGWQPLGIMRKWFLIYLSLAGTTSLMLGQIETATYALVLAVLAIFIPDPVREEEDEE